jgi:Skp family chaperone for outer membrane proteins
MIFSNTLLVMKKYFLVFLTVFAAVAATAQSRGLKIAYIDMEYILDKVPDYADSKNQLEQKAQKWKQEIDVKRNEINKLRESLSAEKSLLTKDSLYGKRPAGLPGKKGLAQKATLLAKRLFW